MDLKERTENQARHPWELSRARCMLRVLKVYGTRGVYADIGAGDRYFTSRLRGLEGEEVFAVDPGYDEEKGSCEGIICLKDISQIPDGGLDHLIMMDVLEHVENEERFFQKALEKLKPGGGIFITVPAISSLFSSHDVFLDHYRRYDKKRFLNFLRGKGIVIERCHYFYTTLLVFRAISVFLEKAGLKKESKKGAGAWRLGPRNFITRVISFILDLDFLCNRLMASAGIDFPGLSLLVVGTRPDHDQKKNAL